MTQTIPRPNALAAESRLLLLCARIAVEPATTESIAQLTRDTLRWGELIALAARNSVTPLLEMHLRIIGCENVPPSLLESLSDRVRAVAAKNLLLTAELLKLAELFRSHGIVPIPYKGPVAAAQAYGNLALREFDDLDIIIRQTDVRKAHEIMVSLGYRARFPWDFSVSAASSPIPGEYDYYEEARHVLVELHTEFTLRHFPVVPNLDDLSRRLVSVSLAGHTLQTFSAEDALPILCIHGSKDFWERLSWVVDVSEMIRSHPQLDWDKVLRLAESLKSERILDLGLFLASSLLDAPLPREVSSRISKDSVVARLANAISERLLTFEWSDLDAASRFRFRCRMLPGFAGWQYAGRLTLTPAEEDWSGSPTPRALAPFYLAFRPLRLLRKYGWRARPSSRILP